MAEEGYCPVVGETVLVGRKKVPAVARFVGETSFSDGLWVGVEFSKPLGKNDGTIQGIRYFETSPLHGMFLRPKLLAKARSESSGSAPPYPSSPVQSSPALRSDSKAAAAAAAATSSSSSSQISCSKWSGQSDVAATATAAAAAVLATATARGGIVSGNNHSSYSSGCGTHPCSASTRIAIAKSMFSDYLSSHGSITAGDHQLHGEIEVGICEFAEIPEFQRKSNLPNLERLSRSEILEQLWHYLDEDDSGGLDEGEFVRFMLAVDQHMETREAQGLFARFQNAAREEACEHTFVAADLKQMSPDFFAELLNHEEGLCLSDRWLRETLRRLHDDPKATAEVEAEAEIEETTTWSPSGCTPATTSAPRSSASMESRRSSVTSMSTIGSLNSVSSILSSTSTSSVASASYVCNGLLRPARASRGWAPKPVSSRRCSAESVGSATVVLKPAVASSHRHHHHHHHHHHPERVEAACSSSLKAGCPVIAEECSSPETMSIAGSQPGEVSLALMVTST